MSVLKSFAATPNRVRSIAETVTLFPGISRSKLYEVICPDAKNNSQFNELFREVKNLGIVIEKDGNVELSDGFASEDVFDIELFLRRLRTVLCPAVEKPSHNNEQFPLAIAWLLSRPIGPHLGLGAEFKPTVLDDLNGDDVFGLTNASICDMLGYWAQSLGFAEKVAVAEKAFCNPDPTRAINAMINDNFEAGSQIPIDRFIKTLSETLPVLEMGHYRREIIARKKNPLDENHLSQSTSLALFRLENRKIISLEEESDDQTMLLSIMEEPVRRISKVTILERSG